MRNCIFSAWKWLPALATFMVLVACTYRDPFGGEWHVDPRPRTPNQTPGCTPEVIGQVTIDGTTYDVFDFNCDGIGDWIRDPNGNYRPIRPNRPTQPPPAVSDRMTLLDPSITTDIAAEQSYANYLVYHTSTFDDPPAGSEAAAARKPMSFDFGSWSAAQWRTHYGLTGFNQPNSSRCMSLQIEFDSMLQAVDMEVTVPWSTEYRFVNPHSNMRFDTQILCDQSGPGFMVMRIGGAPTSVLRYLMSTAGSFTMSSFDVDTGTLFTVTVDESQGTALITADGTPLQLLQL